MQTYRPLIREKHQFTTIRRQGLTFSRIGSYSRRVAVVALSLSAVTLVLVMATSSDQTQTLEMYPGAATTDRGREETAANDAQDIGTQRLNPIMQLLGRMEEYFTKDFSYLQYASIPKTVTRASETLEIGLAENGNFDDSRLINLTDFKYKINKVNFCPPRPEKPFLIVLVHSAVANRPKRDAVRLSWGLSAPVLFFLGATGDEAVQRRLLAEDELHHDLVQGSFLDTYRNLTYKHAMLLKWTLTYCSGVRYLVKMDDDSFLNVPYLLGTLHDLSPTGARNLLACTLSHNTVYRYGRWAVSREEWPGDSYPDYCNGWFLIYSMDVAARIYMEALKHKYFWIDDVHMTGTLMKALQITHSDIRPLTAGFDGKFLDLPIHHILGIYGLNEMTVVNMTHRFMNSHLPH